MSELLHRSWDATSFTDVETTPHEVHAAAIGVSVTTNHPGPVGTALDTLNAYSW
jgi:hypothetical protein